MHLGEYLAEMHVPLEIAVDKTLGRGQYSVQGDAQQRLGAVHAVDSVLRNR
ncbi:MAG: hypothetical protein ACYDAG_01925 [Chloroflexota bacterium]